VERLEMYTLYGVLRVDMPEKFNIETVNVRVNSFRINLDEHFGIKSDPMNWLQEDPRKTKAPAMRALEELTPGGSEFVNNVPNCVRHVEDERRNRHNLCIRFKCERDKAIIERDAAIESLKLYNIVDNGENQSGA
jgi:hypothetical protein